MSDIPDEIEDVFEEVTEATDALGEDMSEALGIDVDVDLQNVNHNHHQGMQATFRYNFDEESLKAALNDVSDGGYEGVGIREAGGVHLHLTVSDEE